MHSLLDKYFLNASCWRQSLRSRAGAWDRTQASDEQFQNRILNSIWEEAVDENRDRTISWISWQISWLFNLGCWFLLMEHGMLHWYVVPQPLCANHLPGNSEKYEEGMWQKRCIRMTKQKDARMPSLMASRSRLSQPRWQQISIT